MHPLRLCSVLAFITVLKASGVSKNALDFLSYVSGDYDNKEQTRELGDDHDLVQIRLIPVGLNCFPTAPVLFVEVAINGTIRVLDLSVVTAGTGDIVVLTIYRINDFTNYKPGQFNVKNLSNTPCQDFQEAKGCTGSFRVSSLGFVFGNYPDCQYTVNGDHPRFTAMHTCNSLTETMPVYSQQRSPMEPYELQFKGQPYPVINPPQDYDSPCGN